MTLSIADNSRLTKILAEKGMPFKQADDFLKKQTLIIHIDGEAAETLAGQAAAITAVATASRCFLGGVQLEGATTAKWLLSSRYESLREAALGHGAGVVGDYSFTIFIGAVPADFKGKGVQVWWNRWRAGIRPLFEPQPCGGGKVPLAGIAAAAMGVAQSFSYSVLGNKAAGVEPWDVNVWDPMDRDGIGPSRVCLPLNLWFLGLGNLGQAFLWSLLMLPFEKPQDVNLVFQDFDRVKTENWITSILTSKDSVGKKKTALAEMWAEQKGFEVFRIERPFTESFSAMGDEPFYCLAGLDSMEARRLLQYCKFPFVLSAGLGSSSVNYHAFDLHVLDRVCGAKEVYGDSHDIKIELADENIKKLAYQELLDGEQDPIKRCGLMEIAGSSAAVPFVSAFVGAFGITRAIQLASSKRPDRSFAGSVLQLTDIRVLQTPELDEKHLGLYSEVMECE